MGHYQKLIFFDGELLVDLEFPLFCLVSEKLLYTFILTFVSSGIIMDEEKEIEVLSSRIYTTCCSTFPLISRQFELLL